MKESQEIARLFARLLKQPLHPFPLARGSVDAPCTQGVYIIRNPQGSVAHVGRSRTGQSGVWGRLCDHLNGKSSFVYYHLKEQRAQLRTGYTFQYLEEPSRRKRALLEALACGSLCPLHVDGKAEE